MSEYIKRLTLLLLLVGPAGLSAVAAQDTVVSEISELKLTANDILSRNAK